MRRYGIERSGVVRSWLGENYVMRLFLHIGVVIIEFFGGCVSCGWTCG